MVNCWIAIALLSLLAPSNVFAGSETAPPGSDHGHGRVLVVENRRAIETFSPRPSVIREMITEGLVRFTGKQSVTDAWRMLVSTQDVLGIKVHSSPGPNSGSGTRPAVVAELIQSLLQAGYNPDRIIIWDRRLIDLRLAGFVDLGARLNVRVAGALDEGYDSNSSYSSSILGRLVFGDLEFGQKGEAVGRKSYVSKLLTQKITRIISVTPLLNHNYAGVSGAVYGLAMSSVDNTLRFEDPERLATAVPEIYALPELADRVALNIVDALICQYRGEERSLLHYSTPLNQLWFSTDAVALDVLGMEEIERQRGGESTRKTGAQIYTNAGLMDLGASDPKNIRIERISMP